MDEQPESTPVEDDQYGDGELYDESDQYDEDDPDDGATSNPEDAASVVAIGRDEDVAAVCGRIDSAPTYAVVLHAPRGNKALSQELGMRRLVRHAEETGRTVAIATRSSGLASRARQSGIPVASGPERVRWDAGRRVVVGIGPRAVVLPAIGSYIQFGVLLIAVIFLAGALLFAGPAADIAVYPVTESIQDRVMLTASLDQNTIDLDNARVPGVRVSASQTVTLAVEATGTAELGTGRATASVVITNPTDEAVEISAGEVVFGPEFYAFEFEQPVTVPADGTAEATVTASEPGPEGNVPEESITGWANESLRVLTITNPEPASGTTAEQVTVVSEQDGLTLRQLARELVDSPEMRELLASQRPDAAIFLNSIELSVSEGEPTPAVGEQANIVFMNATLVLSALAVDADTLDQIAPEVLAGDVDRGIFVNGSVVAADTGADQSEDDGAYTAEFLITGEFSDAISEQDVRNAVSGKRPESAESALLSREGIRSANVDLTPGWAPWLPRFDFRIDVEFRSLNGEEPADDAPPVDGEDEEDGGEENGGNEESGDDTDDEPAAGRNTPPVALARHRSRRTPDRRCDQ